MAFRILQPCHRTWSSLEGEGSLRHCDECNHKVYDLSHFTEKDLRRRLARGERICSIEGTTPRRSFFAWAAGALSTMRLSAWQPTTRILWRVTLITSDGVPLPFYPVVIKLNGGETKITSRTNANGALAIDLDWRPSLSVSFEGDAFLPTNLRLKQLPQEATTVTLQIRDHGPVIGLTAETAYLQTEVTPKLLPPKPHGFVRFFRRLKSLIKP